MGSERIAGILRRWPRHADRASRRRVYFDASYWFSKAIDLGADYTNTAYDADTRISRSQSEFETQRDRKALSLSISLTRFWRGWLTSSPRGGRFF